MRDVAEEMVAVAFSCPKVKAVLGALLLVFCVEVFAKPQDDHLPSFKLKIFAGQVDLVPRDEAQDPLVVFGQGVFDGSPGLGHVPENLGLRFSMNARTPSA